MSKSRPVAISLIVLGLVVLAAASVVPVVLPVRMFWTEEQAREQATAASRLHQATHQTAHIEDSKTASQTDKLQAEQTLQAAQARYEASRAALDRAQFWRLTIPRIMRWTSGGITILGVLIYLSATGMND